MAEQQFYDYIVQLSDFKNSKQYLNTVTEAVANFILKDYKKNISIAASYGRSEAFLCIYKIDTVIDNKIVLHNYINPDKQLMDLYVKYQLDPVLTRIEKKIKPFYISTNIQEDNYIISVCWAKSI